MLYEDLNMRYTSEENDNVNIFPCAADWTAIKLQDMNYDIFNGADLDVFNMIANWLTEPSMIAESMNLKIWV